MRREAHVRFLGGRSPRGEPLPTKEDVGFRASCRNALSAAWPSFVLDTESDLPIATARTGHCLCAPRPKQYSGPFVLSASHVVGRLCFLHDRPNESGLPREEIVSMIAITKSPRPTANAQHDDRFLVMVPAIQRYARSAFRNLRPSTCEDAVCAVVADAFFAFRRLVELGKQDVAYATPLARFAVRRYWTGRCACMPRGRDMMSRKAGTTHGIVVERLDMFDEDQCKWRQALVEDRHAGPAEIAASRLDDAAWLRSLPRRDRRVARNSVVGEHDQ